MSLRRAKRWTRFCESSCRRGTCEPEQFLVNGDKVTLIERVNYRRLQIRTIGLELLQPDTQDACHTDNKERTG